MDFVLHTMKVPEDIIEQNYDVAKCCYESALELIPKEMGLTLLPIIYRNTVYNAAASLLIRYGEGQYWEDIRDKLGVNDLPSLGVVNQAADQRTSVGMKIGKSLSNLSLMDLMMLQDPYGAKVSAVLMELGPHWGYTK